LWANAGGRLRSRLLSLSWSLTRCDSRGSLSTHEQDCRGWWTSRPDEGGVWPAFAVYRWPWTTICSTVGAEPGAAQFAQSTASERIGSPPSPNVLKIGAVKAAVWEESATAIGGRDSRGPLPRQSPPESRPIAEPRSNPVGPATATSRMRNSSGSGRSAKVPQPRLAGNGQGHLLRRCNASVQGVGIEVTMSSRDFRSTSRPV